MTFHPRLNEKGLLQEIHHPHKPSSQAAWMDPALVAVAVPDGKVPASLHGIPLAQWRDRPDDRAVWARMAEAEDFEEPPFDAMGKKPAAGAVVVEPDGRVWIVAPTNAFLGTKATFPKGQAKGMDLKATAMKEVFEESGLRVRLFQHLVDVTRSLTRTRYYLARRVGGSPAAMGWESQAVMLAPVETLKGFLNVPADHEVVEALDEHWGGWKGWHHPEAEGEPDLEEAASGRIPAQRRHWTTLPLPKARTRIDLDIHLDAKEAACLKLGFIPRMMEQKWFTYFQDGILYEHRSWTGFCISKVHFSPEGDGIRATHAEVNRLRSQDENTDDREDTRLITERVLQLARLTPEDRHAEDPFVAAMMAATVPNYLGNPQVVSNLLEPFFNALVHRQVLQWEGGGTQDTYQEILRLNTFLAHVFAGENDEYPPIGAWNSPQSLGQTVVRQFGMDPDYYADENLFCILSEGLAAVDLKARGLAEEYQADPAGEFERDFLPSVAKLGHFTASVLMGTHSVVFPDLALADITYKPFQGGTSGVDLPE